MSRTTIARPSAASTPKTRPALTEHSHPDPAARPHDATSLYDSLRDLVVADLDTRAPRGLSSVREANVSRHDHRKGENA